MSGEILKLPNQQTFYETVNSIEVKDIIDPLRQLAFDHTVYGAKLVLWGEILNQPSKLPDLKALYETGQLTIGRITFDLSKPRDFHLASAIVDTKILQKFWEGETQSQDLKRQEDARRAFEEAETNLRYLYYITEKLNNIYFTRESYLYFPTELFVAMAKVTQALEKHGYPLPKTIMVAKTIEDNAGSYVDHDRPNSPLTVILRGNTSDSGVIHEWGHFLSDISDSANLKNYQQIVEAVKLLYTNQAMDFKNQYVSEYAQKNIKEDYAETFEWYFWFGDDFRAKLEELKTKDPTAYQILQVKYDFFKNIDFEGEEFHNRGVSFAEETQTKIEVETKDQIQTNYQVGDLVRIVDEDEETSGILLRPQPIASIDYKDQSWLAVFNDDEVELIGRPEEITRHIFNYETNQYVEVKENWWRVRISRQGEKSYNLLGRIKGEGWISEIWFGEKVEKGQ